MKWPASVAIASILGLGTALIATNPKPAAYRLYASEQFRVHLKQEVCAKASFRPSMGSLFFHFSLGELPLGLPCSGIVDRLPQSWIENAIAKNTKPRHNFILFSIYRTELTLGPLPDYTATKIGLFRNFYSWHPPQTTQH